MKIVLTGLLLCSVVLAQNTRNAAAGGAAGGKNSAPFQSAQSPSEPASGGIRVAPGSVVPVRLTKTIDARKVKSGDEVEAKVTQDLKAGSGEIVIPKDTKITGHITEAQARNKEQKESQLGITFDRAAMKNGGDVTLPMSIQAIIAPSVLNAGNSDNGGGESAAQPTSAPGTGGMSPGANGGRTGGMGSGTQPQAQGSGSGRDWPTQAQPGKGPHPPITGETKGVVGIPNLNLSSGENATQGSVLSSERNNVKLESGTLMLLRVNP